MIHVFLGNKNIYVATPAMREKNNKGKRNKNRENYLSLFAEIFFCSIKNSFMKTICFNRSYI